MRTVAAAPIVAVATEKLGQNSEAAGPLVLYELRGLYGRYAHGARCKAQSKQPDQSQPPHLNHETHYQVYPGYCQEPFQHMLKADRKEKNQEKYKCKI